MNKHEKVWLFTPEGQIMEIDGDSTNGFVSVTHCENGHYFITPPDRGVCPPLCPYDGKALQGQRSGSLLVRFGVEHG